MQFYGMEPDLVDIYNIRNLETIKIWEMVSMSSGQDMIVPAILITYDGGKSLNLCAKDKHFDTYVKKVFQVYSDEKDNILEDALSNPFRTNKGIDIDEKTKRILDSGKLESINEVYSFYQNKDSFDTSLTFQIDEVKSLIDIVKYHIMRLFSFTNKVIVFDNEEITGYRTNYAITGTIDGVDRTFPFSFDKTDNNSFIFYVGGIINFKPIIVKVQFLKDSIQVNIDLEEYGLISESRYVITNGVVKEIHDVTKNGLTISYKNEDLAKVDENELQNLADIDEPTSLIWFRLPWGALYGINTNIIDISVVEKIIEICNMYIGIFENGFVKKEYYSKRYKRSRTEASSANDVILDEVRKNLLGVCIDNESKVYVLETSFDTDTVSNGFYNGVLNGKHYYHACKSTEGLKGIKKDRLVSLGKKHIITNSDLVNKYKILNLIKGE